MNYDGASVKAWAGDSQWRACRADFARFRKYNFTSELAIGLAAVVLYRLQKIVRTSHPRWLWAPARLALRIVNNLFMMMTQIRIDPDAEIGPGLLIPHVGPIRVHGTAKIGADCVIYHLCTIGVGPRPGGATIGDHVFIGCNSSIIGEVTIGDRATVSANSLVIRNVPAGTTALGVPARILPELLRNF
jgi:serine O-acetyltransferase